MLRYLRFAVYYSTIATGAAVALLQEDFALLAFGGAVMGAIVVLVHLVLALAMGAVLSVAEATPVTPATAGRQIVAIQVSLFSVVAVTATAFCTYVFMRCFAMQALAFSDPSALLLKLAWVSSVACFPWAHIVGAEEAYGPNTAHTELVLAGLVAGCAVIVSVCLFAEAEPSWPFMAAIFAATQLIALVAVVRRA
jgi:hypothetical protein